jgi:hypothetical protein
VPFLLGRQLLLQGPVQQLTQRSPTRLEPMLEPEIFEALEQAVIKPQVDHLLFSVLWHLDEYTRCF